MTAPIKVDYMQNFSFYFRTHLFHNIQLCNNEIKYNKSKAFPVKFTLRVNDKNTCIVPSSDRPNVDNPSATII